MPVTHHAATFGEKLRSLAAADPGRPAITCGDETIPRAEFVRRGDQLARAFAEQGIGPGDFVGIGLPTSAQFLVAALATWNVGAIPQPLPARITPGELSAILGIVRPAGLVGLPAPAGGPVELPAEASGRSDEPLPPVVAPTWKALMSGGSTGLPKTIVTHTPALADRVTAIAPLLRMPEDSVAVFPAPMHHNAPFMFSVIALLRGNHVILQPRFDSERVLEAVNEHKAEWLYLVPTMMHRIWRLGPEARDAFSLDSLRTVVHMAAPCPQWLKRNWLEWLGADRVLEVFSVTEGLAASSITGGEWLAHPGSVGKVVSGQIKIVGPDGQECPPGQPGCLLLRGSADDDPGYHYLGAQPTVIDGWQSLGDLGYFDEDGYLYLNDRDSDMIIVGGANVYPAEIEAALERHPDVQAACVFGIPHTDLGAVPHAVVQSAAAIGFADMDAFLRQHLLSYKLPRGLTVTLDPIRDDVGKMRRSALRADWLRRNRPEGGGGAQR